MLDLLPVDGRSSQAVRSLSRPRPAGPTIWAVASGKGGVGKSVVGASLAIGLSQTGPRTVAVDLDLGGANLHTLFGCARAPQTLTDFIQGRVRSIEAALAVTSVPGVRLLSGARASLDLAYVPYAQKQKILRGISRIDTGHVVLDLGAGSSTHTLDAFVAADRRILVVTPEATSIENAFHFLKAAFFRSLRDVPREAEGHAAITAVLDEARNGGATPLELVEAVMHADAKAGALVSGRMREFDVDLVVNRADALGELDPGEEIAKSGRAQLGLNIRHAGSLATDASVPAAVERGVPVMQLFPASAFCIGVHALIASLFADEPASATRAVALAALPPAPVIDETSAPAAATVAARSLLRVPYRTGVSGRTLRNLRAQLGLGGGAASPVRAKSERSAPASASGSAWAAPHRAASPGNFLRYRREQLGLDLEALHEHTRIRHHLLEGIEQEQFDTLPPDVILREHVRQIADALGLSDPDEHARRFIEKARAKRSAIALAGLVSRVKGDARPSNPIPGARELSDEGDELASLGDESVDSAPLNPHSSGAEVESFLGSSYSSALSRRIRLLARR